MDDLLQYIGLFKIMDALVINRITFCVYINVSNGTVHVSS